MITQKTKLLALSLLFSLNGVGGDLQRINKRCEEDNLNPQQATERVHWGLKCAKSNGGQFHGLSKNKFMSLLYDFDFDTGKKTQKPRPEYPIFTTGNLAKVWKAPISRNAGCGVPGGYKIMGFCLSSCYTGDQMILFSDGYIPIKEALENQKQEIVVVDSSSSLNAINLRLEAVNSYTRSTSVKAKNTILTFRTKYGEALKVTSNHPLVNQDGKIVRADSFKVGDSLISVDGDKEEIISITTQDTEGYVYNVQPEVVKDSLGTLDISGQIVIAQGYLSGSNYLQNEGIKYLHSFTLRNEIPEDLL